MTKQVALLRGRHLNFSEMQSYVRLHQTSEYECIGIGADYGNPPDLPFPVRQPRSVEGITAEVHPKVGTGVDLALSTVGANNHLIGLEEALADVDIVHTVETYWPFSAQAAKYCSQHDIPFVVTQWENIPHNFEDCRIHRRYKRQVHKHADAFVAITDRAAFALRSEGVNDERITIISPGMDTNRFSPANSNSDPDEILDILFIGRLNRVKGLFFLLEAVYRLLEIDLPPFQVSLVGHGPDEQALRNYAEQLGITERITFEGYVPYEEIPERYRNADLFVLPSISTDGWQEQFGMVLAEAMASGLPVVTTRSGSIPEVVGDAAELVQPADALSLADQLADLLRNPTKRENLGEKARKRAETIYSLDRFVDQTATLYDSL